MPDFAIAEAYFIGAMMILILVICSVAVYFFFRQLKREKADTQSRKEQEKAKKRIFQEIQEIFYGRNLHI